MFGFALSGLSSQNCTDFFKDGSGDECWVNATEYFIGLFNVDDSSIELIVERWSYKTGQGLRWNLAD